MSDTDLSSRIRQRREQLGLSQEELAARMGYRSKSSITKLEKGINDLPRAKLRNWPPLWTPHPRGSWASWTCPSLRRVSSLCLRWCGCLS